MDKKFQDCGVAIGLVSYPLDTDGRSIFKDEFENLFFKQHIESINKYSFDTLEEHLYKPKGYRLFGNYGLAILSLIDDFAFCDRVFHANHGYKSDKGTRPSYKYTCKVITGITDSKEEHYLKDKAKKTFLKDKERYPFIGIVKLKINYSLLFGKGTKFTDQLKEYIEQKLEVESRKKLNKNNRQEKNHGFTRFDYLILDCFDNDELTIISFSNNIEFINLFFSSLRNITEEDLNNSTTQQDTHQHIFLSSYINIGYDIDYNFSRQENDQNKKSEDFLPVIELDKIRIKVIWETRVGHYQVFKDYIKRKLEKEVGTIEASLTGGNALSFHMPLKEIHKLEDLCEEKQIRENETAQEVVKTHIRKIKIVLCSEETIYPSIERSNLPLKNSSSDTNSMDDEKTIFDSTYLDNIRTRLNECRVSKIVRERLIKIYGLFNESIKDMLHAGYFFELKGALRNIEKILEDFLANPYEKIEAIDTMLSESITAIEEAYYNRFHQKDIRDTNLEYNGGIQQHVTSFNLAYREILKLLESNYKQEDNNNVQKERDVFISISGYEKVTSSRINLRLNINQITYPELFAITIWKEAANFSYVFLRKSIKIELADSEEKRLVNYYAEKVEKWNRFITDKNTFFNLGLILKNQKYFIEEDETYHILSKLINGKTFEYFLIDSSCYHFGFHRNFELLYHFYWKYFLQISQHYDRNGRIEKEYFIPYLLRLFMIGFRYNYKWKDEKELDKDNNENFLNGQRFKPFDPVLSELWFLCYEKVYKCALTIWNELNKFHFEEVSEYEINAMERPLLENNEPMTKFIEGKFETESNDDSKTKPDNRSKTELIVPVANALIISERKTAINILKSEIEKFHLAQWEDFSLGNNDFLICLFNAYLSAIKELDDDEKNEIHSLNKNKKIRCIPRDKKGKILLNYPYLTIKTPEEKKVANENKDKMNLRKKISNLPADSLGGFFIMTPEARKKYFAYRSSFYRSLWNFSMQKNIKYLTKNKEQ